MEERERILAFLEQAFSWKHNSLAAYIVGAEPYVEPGEEETLKAVQSIAAEDQKTAVQIGQAIESLGGVPRIAPYEPSVAELNYLSISYLAEVLLEKLKKELLYYSEDPGALALTKVGSDLPAMLTGITSEQIKRLSAQKL